MEQSGKKQIRSFEDLSRRLGSVNGFTYGAIYLILIPIFALIYQALPYHFYHTTINYESSLNTHAQNILYEFRAWEMENFEKHHGDFYIERDGYVLNSTTIEATHITVSGDSIEIRFSIDIYPKREFSFDDKYKKDLRIRLPLETGIKEYQPNGDKFAIKDYSFEGDISPFEPFELFPHDETHYQERLMIKFPLEFDDSLRGYAFATRGFPSRSVGGFVRMLYFSATTITTVSLGDILPITTVSRMLVTIESVLGLILIGLFLNSLTYQINIGQTGENTSPETTPVNVAQQSVQRTAGRPRKNSKATSKKTAAKSGSSTSRR